MCRPFFRNLNAKVKIAGEYHYIYPYSNSKDSPVSSKNHEMSLNLASMHVKRVVEGGDGHAIAKRSAAINRFFFYKIKKIITDNIKTYLSLSTQKR